MEIYSKKSYSCLAINGYIGKTALLLPLLLFVMHKAAKYNMGAIERAK